MKLTQLNYLFGLVQNETNRLEVISQIKKRTNSKFFLTTGGVRRSFGEDGGGPISQIFTHPCASQEGKILILFEDSLNLMTLLMRAV